MTESSGMEDVVDEVATVTSAMASQPGSEEASSNYAWSVPDVAKAKIDSKNRLLPHIIAHRGFKARFPENSLLAFREAVRAGATAIETDTRLTEDKHVVLSHEPDLKLFGHAGKRLAATRWDEIEHLTCSASPHEPMPQLEQLLRELLKPEFRNIWLLLDIKSNEDPEPLMQGIASAFVHVAAPADQPWNERVVLGLWAAWQLPLAATKLPGFPALNIGLNMTYSRNHFGHPNLGSLFLIQTLLGPGGRSFIKERQRIPGPTMAWTVNERDQAEWCARRGLDGIVTDDPSVITQVWRGLEWEKEEGFFPISLWTYYNVLKVWVRVNFYFGWFVEKLKLEDYALRKGLIEKKSQ